MADFEGMVEDIVYRNEQNGFTVLSVKLEDGKELSAVGTLPFLTISYLSLTMPMAILVPPRSTPIVYIVNPAFHDLRMVPIRANALPRAVVHTLSL